jgi:hypothetical protein
MAKISEQMARVGGLETQLAVSLAAAEKLLNQPRRRTLRRLTTHAAI